MAEMIDEVKKVAGNTLRPVFITCDPARDTPAVMKTYLKEFHPDIIGLTGTYDDIKNVCKKYRVYFSTPPDVKSGQDYLVDHSIYFYLMGESGSHLAWKIFANSTMDLHLQASICADAIYPQIPKATLSRPWAGTNQPRRRQRLSSITSGTGAADWIATEESRKCIMMELSAQIHPCGHHDPLLYMLADIFLL